MRNTKDAIRGSFCKAYSLNPALSTQLFRGENKTFALRTYLEICFLASFCFFIFRSSSPCFFWRKAATRFFFSCSSLVFLSPYSSRSILKALATFRSLWSRTTATRSLLGSADFSATFYNKIQCFTASGTPGIEEVCSSVQQS
jgi:hypothetical protein